MKIKLLAILLFSIFSSVVFAQAYDGRTDTKIFLGYSLVGKTSGVEIQFDQGITDYVSYGLKGIVLINPRKHNEGDGEFERTANAFNSFDMGVFLRFHFTDVLKMKETMDPYLGLDVSLKSLGVHTGFKYNFSETLGLYIQYAHSFSGSISGISKEDSTDSSFNFFGKTGVIGGGLTINL